MVSNQIDWNEIISLYNTIKSLYALCEETDPELKTNLQPLNEFRAALDHMMRIAGIEKTNEYQNKNAAEEATKLKSHLRRALFDICDMLAINYRTKIIDSLQEYSAEEIQFAIPTYYSSIRPRIETISENIAELRTEKRFNSLEEEETAVNDYPVIINELRDYNMTITKAIPSLIEISEKNKSAQKKKDREALIWQKIVPIVSIIVGIVIGIVGWTIT